MANSNGIGINNVWIWRTAIGILFAVLMFLGSNVIANDAKREADKTEVWKEIGGIRQEMGDIRQNVAVQGERMKNVQDDMEKMSAVQTTILQEIRKISR